MRFRKLLCRPQTRIDLLFTMSDITHDAVHPDHACEVMFRGRLFGLAQRSARLRSSSFAGHASINLTGRAARSQRRSVVEPDGIEPTTSCLQSTRSPS